MNYIKYRGKKMAQPSYKVLILIMCSLVFAGCSYPPLKNDATLSDDYTYIIGPGDNVNIFVWGHPDVSMSVPVRPDGKITLPLVEDVVAIGKTPYEMARTMEKELGVYIRDPKVVVMVTGFQGVYEQQVRIVGQIGGGSSGSSGSGGSGGSRYSGQTVPYEKGMTLLDLVIIIGQIGQYADGNRASIIRNVNGKPQQFGVKMDDLIEDADMSLNVKIMPGDILVIPEAFF
jgi:polysaccharide export outer membrane protein